jgi:hypothetical protein
MATTINTPPATSAKPLAIYKRLAGPPQHGYPLNTLLPSSLCNPAAATQRHATGQRPLVS